MRDALLRAARAELAIAGPGGISLRAIARRAGVSHAAPKHHFQDRAGLLTALAIDGFHGLAGALRHAGRAPDADPVGALAALGGAYVRTALANPDVFALMFRPELLHEDDPELLRAQRQAFAPLADLAAAMSDGSDAAPDLALMAWSFAHGVAMLARDGALQRTARIEAGGTEALAMGLTDQFARRIVRQPPAVR